ncbi:MAG TPA: serine hydrolase domain-containing protein, partial [bacterium]|nr:serine hydrolase domain-containing protein [bacterium]
RMQEPSAEPMTLDTIFDMASCTKATSTASAVMLLVQDGKIGLDDPVAKHVPEFTHKDKDSITILSLLTHCSGLPAYTNAQYLEEHYGPRPKPDALIQRISELPVQGSVGEKYIYSCLNYLVLARVVQNVCGENMSDFLRERLWSPLGMKETTFYLNEKQLAQTAPTIYEKGTLRRGLVHDPLAYYSVCEKYAPGNAGMFSTAEDLSRYVRMILKGGTWGRRTVFTPDTWARITTNQSPSTLDTKRSCGWGIWTENAYATPLNNSPETAVLGHTGYTGTLIWMDKLSKCYVIFLSNCVYPEDKSETKDAVIQGRRRIISVLLDHLEMYRGVRNESK